MTKRPDVSLQAWMQRTGTNARTLAKLARMDETHLSKILTRSRRCSLEKALRLNDVTGVPVENLIRWMANAAPAQIKRAVKTRGRKCA